MADTPKPKAPACPQGRFPHRYDVEDGECEIDRICHEWESNRRETRMEERESFRRRLHANPEQATLIASVI